MWEKGGTKQEGAQVFCEPKLVKENERDLLIGDSVVSFGATLQAAADNGCM